MATMNVSIPDTLLSFVEAQVTERGHGTTNEYICQFIRNDQERLQLRRLILDGATSAPAGPADSAYFDTLRERARR